MDRLRDGLGNISDNFGIISGSFCDHFKFILDTFYAIWDHVRDILRAFELNMGTCWDHSRDLLGAFSVRFDFIFVICVA